VWVYLVNDELIFCSVHVVVPMRVNQRWCCSVKWTWTVMTSWPEQNWTKYSYSSTRTVTRVS